MSKGVLTEDIHNKTRNLSMDFRVVPEKPTAFKMKFQNLSRKPRQKNIVFEKERLYDENLQLKQLSNSLQDENHRLKTRLLQIEQDFKKPTEKEYKGSNIVLSLKLQIKALKEKVEKMQSEYNELKASVKVTRVIELEEEAKQYFNECWRLKKIIEEGFKSKPIGSPNHSRGELIDKIREQNEEIQGLKSENTLIKSRYEQAIKEAQNMKNKLQSAEDELESTKTELKQMKEQKNNENEIFENLIKSEESKDSLAPPAIQTFKRIQTNVKDDSKNLVRELGSSPQVILDRFFRNLNEQLTKKYLSTEEFIKIIDPQGSSIIDLTKLPIVLQENAFNFPVNELKVVYSILSAQGPEISLHVILDNLQAIESESNKSYDISSESSFANNYGEKALAMAKIQKVKFEEIEEVFGNLYVLLTFGKYSKENFQRFLCEKLPSSVTFANLAKLFLENCCRIEDGVERNKVCSYLLDSEESIERRAVSDKILGLIYRDFTEDEEVKKEKFLKILDEVNEKKKEFIEKCKEKDDKDKGWLSWNVIESLLRLILKNWDDVGVLQLKVKSFGIEKSLNIIPYTNIFDLS